MLIPNKFNGYNADGIRRYPIGMGIGEAALAGTVAAGAEAGAAAGALGAGAAGAGLGAEALGAGALGAGALGAGAEALGTAGVLGAGLGSTALGGLPAGISALGPSAIAAYTNALASGATIAEATAAATAAGSTLSAVPSIVAPVVNAAATVPEAAGTYMMGANPITGTLGSSTLGGAGSIIGSGQGLGATSLGGISALTPSATSLGAGLTPASAGVTSLYSGLPGYASQLPAEMTAGDVLSGANRAYSGINALNKLTNPGQATFDASGRVNSAMDASRWGSEDTVAKQVPQDSGRSLPDWFYKKGTNDLDWTKIGMLGGAGIVGGSMLFGKKNNLLPQYQPPTAQQYGLGATLASNYRPVRFAEGGLTVPGILALNNPYSNDPTEEYSAADGGLMGENLYPMSQQNASQYSTASQLPAGAHQVAMQAKGNNITHMASGGISSLGSYSDGGRMLKGPGDGMSDDIPATIGGNQPARLADGEFVVPADVVSHMGNGSTDAGAKKLYGMMDRVRKARTGTKKQGKQIKAEKYMPA